MTRGIGELLRVGTHTWPLHLSAIKLHSKGRDDPEVIREGELTLLLTSCNTRKSKPCTSHLSSIVELALDVEVVGEPTGVSVEKLALPIVCYAATSVREKPSPLSFALTICSGKESWPRL